MTLEGSGGSKLTELVTYHILGNLYRAVLASIVDRARVTDEFREDRRSAGPCLENFLLILRVHGFDSFEKLLFDERAFSDTSAHLWCLLLSYLPFLDFTMNLLVRAFLFLVL